jgi:hypothetical protein
MGQQTPRQSQIEAQIAKSKQDNDDYKAQQPKKHWH